MATIVFEREQYSTGGGYAQAKKDAQVITTAMDVRIEVVPTTTLGIMTVHGRTLLHRDGVLNHIIIMITSKARGDRLDLIIRRRIPHRIISLQRATRVQHPELVTRVVAEAVPMIVVREDLTDTQFLGGGGVVIKIHMFAKMSFSMNTYENKCSKDLYLIIF